MEAGWWEAKKTMTSCNAFRLFLVAIGSSSVWICLRGSRLIFDHDNPHTGSPNGDWDWMDGRPNRLSRNTGAVVVHDDIHNSSVAVLDLLDWEVASLEKPYDESCHTPDGVDDVCCLGVNSKSGKILTKQRVWCDHLTLEDYQKVRNHAQNELLENSHSSTTTPCDVCHILETLKAQNLTFGFFGDSITNQVVQGFICELQRRKYRVHKTELELPKQRGDNGKRHFKVLRRLTIQSPLWEKNETVDIDFMFQYALPFLFPEQLTWVASQYDILISSLGMHWVYQPSPTDRLERERYNKDTYAQMLSELFGAIRVTGKVRLLAHRESSAQHFDAEGGENSLARSDPRYLTNMTCVPMTYGGGLAGWREPLVQQAAKMANYTTVVTAGASMPAKTNYHPDFYILPYFNYSAVHYEMHPRRQRSGWHLDCTHVCSSPFVYQPIWRYIRLAMDREFNAADETQ